MDHTGHRAFHTLQATGSQTVSESSSRAARHIAARQVYASGEHAVAAIAAVLGVSRRHLGVLGGGRSRVPEGAARR
jgi:hypothetical protein